MFLRLVDGDGPITGKGKARRRSIGRTSMLHRDQVRPGARARTPGKTDPNRHRLHQTRMKKALTIIDTLQDRRLLGGPPRLGLVDWRAGRWCSITGFSSLIV